MISYAWWIVRQKKKTKQILHDVTYMWNTKNKTNLIKKKQTHRYREQTSGYQWRREGQCSVGRVGVTKYWMQDRLKDVFYNMGTIANIL